MFKEIRINSNDENNDTVLMWGNVGSIIKLTGNMVIFHLVLSYSAQIYPRD